MSQRQRKLTGHPELAQSLADFMKQKARAGCLVCKLPSTIRAQLGPPAVKRGFTRPEQLEWLRTACGAPSITLEMLATHLSARHDSAEDLNVNA